VVSVCPTGCPYTSVSVALRDGGAGDTIMLASGLHDFEFSVNITVPLTLSSLEPAEVYPQASTGLPLLTVFSNLTLAGDLTIYSAALRIVEGGRVALQGALTVVPPRGIGVQVEQGGAFIQQGPLAITALDNATIGMFCEGEWLQLGSFHANSSAHEQPCAQTPRGCLEPFTVWLYGGRWTQNGTVNITAAHVAAGMVLSEWVQNAPVQLSVFANEPPLSTAAVAALMIANGLWRQKAPLDLVASRRNALYLGEVGPGWVAATLWLQDASVNLRVLAQLDDEITGDSFVGVEVNSLNMFWNQNGDVVIHLLTPSLTRAFNCKAQGSWNVQQGNLSIVPPEASSLGSCVRTLPFVSNTTSSSNSSVSDNSEQPVLRFDATNTLQIVPKTTSELNPDQFTVVEEARVGLSFASITEVAANGTRLQTGQVLFGAWSVLPSNSLGASQAFVLKSTALVNNQAPKPLQPPCLVEMEVFLFDEATNVSISDLASFTVLPALTKVAIRISSWPWLSTNDNSSRLEVRLAVSPSFTNVTYPASSPPAGPVPSKRQDASSSGLTSLILGGQRSSDGKRALSTEVRFVSVVEFDGVVQGPSGVGRAPVEFGADVETSSLVLSFGHFAANMSYDPDLGVLVGRRDRERSLSSASDDKTWVIAVSIAVPLAVVAVVAVIMMGVALLAVQKRRRARELQKRLGVAPSHEDL